MIFAHHCSAVANYGSATGKMFQDKKFQLQNVPNTKRPKYKQPQHILSR
jgi:hypothetical protein